MALVFFGFFWFFLGFFGIFWFFWVFLVFGFWEIINKSPKTGFTIQVLTEELDGGMVLKRGNFMTKSTFSLNQVYLYCKANYYMKEILDFIIKNKKLPIYSDSIPWSPRPTISNSFGFGGHNGSIVIGPT